MSKWLWKGVSIGVHIHTVPLLYRVHTSWVCPTSFDRTLTLHNGKVGHCSMMDAITWVNHFQNNCRLLCVAKFPTLSGKRNATVFRVTQVFHIHLNSVTLTRKVEHSSEKTKHIIMPQCRTQKTTIIWTTNTVETWNSNHLWQLQHFKYASDITSKTSVWNTFKQRAVVQARV